MHDDDESRANEVDLEHELLLSFDYQSILGDSRVLLTEKLLTIFLHYFFILIKIWHGVLALKFHLKLFSSPSRHFPGIKTADEKVQF